MNLARLYFTGQKSFEERARKRLLNFQDKLWSITDMTSFLFMEESKINYFLSFDHDFHQASCHFEFVDVRPYIGGSWLRE
jgi:predicted nucleic acid-binding protein